jgi:hypothetical protein
MNGWLVIALLATWLLIVVVVPSALGHAFHHGLVEGGRAGYKQGRADERNGIPATLAMGLLPADERRDLPRRDGRERTL